MGTRRTFHFVPHTHWDREWYLTEGEFRFRLIRIVDRLMDLLDRDPAFRHFHFDGQTIVLEDYLELRPENRQRLESLISSGRIAVGPWYVLPDEFLVSAEALVRNIEIGLQLARDAGARDFVGYLPDMFGHIGQMPQILALFGIGEAFLWRGISGGSKELKSEFSWAAPDGSELLVLHFHDRHGYANGKNLGIDLPGTETELAGLEAEMAPFALTSNLLMMNGVDHLEARENLSVVLGQLNAGNRFGRCLVSSLREYEQAVRAELGAAPLRKINGELREVDRTPGRGWYNFILQGTLSSRMWIKQENHRCQNLLEYWAEPFAAHAALRGGEDYRAFILRAWKTLLKNHPHDNICGCSTDEVHDSDRYRFVQASETASRIRDLSLEWFASRIQAQDCGVGEVRCVVFNPLPWERGGRVEFDADFPRDLPVFGMLVCDDTGRELNVEMLGASDQFLVPNVPDLYPPDGMKEVRRWQIAFNVDRIAPMGWSSFMVKALPRPLRPWNGMTENPRSFENSWYRATVELDGTLSVLDKASGRRFVGLGRLEDSGDAGNEYVYSRPLQDSLVVSGNTLSIKRDHCGPDGCRFVIHTEMEIPASLSHDGRRRAEALVRLDAETCIVLHTHLPRIDFCTRVENRAKDHRLRVQFPTWLDTTESISDAHFNVVRRPVKILQPAYDEWTEDAPATMPMRSWCAASDGSTGLAVFSRGLPEYELCDTAERPLALTLLRSVGSLGGGPGNLALSRPAGPDIATPGAQCLGSWKFDYAILAFQGSWEEAGITRAAAEYVNPLHGHSPITKNSPKFPTQASLAALKPVSLEYSAFRQLPGDGTELRVFNPTDETLEGRAEFPGLGITQAVCTDLDGHTMVVPEISGSTVGLTIGPKKIVTLRLVFKEAGT